MLRRKIRKPWHEDPQFWRIAHPFLFTEQRWKQTPRQVSDLIKRCRIKRGMRVLDLCCGPGRISLELSRRGYDVTGVDAQRQYLMEAKRRARRENLRCQFLHGDMRSFRAPEQFDVVLNIFTSFGYFRAQRENMRVLANIVASLKPKGKLYMEIMSRERLKQIFKPKGWEELHGTFILEERRPMRRWRWMHNRWIFITKGQVKEFTISHHLYGKKDLSTMLRQTGFRRVWCSSGAKRLVVVATK